MPIQIGTEAPGGGFSSGGSISGGSAFSGSSVGSSGSGSGSGSSNNNTMSNLPNLSVGALRQASHGVIEFTCGVFRETADRVTRGPGFRVPDGAVVQLTPQTNVGAVNTADAFFFVGGTGDGAKNSANRVRVAPGANPYTVRVRNLNQVQVYSTVVGEGFVIQILQGA